MIATSIGAVSLTNVVEVFFVRGVLHASPTVFGLLMSVWTATMIVGGWLLARRKLHDGALGTALGGVLLSLATPRVLLLAAGLAGFAVVVAFAPRVHRAGRRYGGQS